MSRARSGFPYCCDKATMIETAVKNNQTQEPVGADLRAFVVLEGSFAWS